METLVKVVIKGAKVYISSISKDTSNGLMLKMVRSNHLRDPFYFGLMKI
jgi:hypothetical protein